MYFLQIILIFFINNLFLYCFFNCLVYNDNHGRQGSQPPTQQGVLHSEERIMSAYQVSYIIEVSIENPDCVAFVQWLQSKGHRASIIDSECSFIDGTPVQLSDRYCFMYKELYSSFLNEGFVSPKF